MIKAADSDADAVEAGKPGLEKQKMLSEVLDMMTKYSIKFRSTIVLKRYLKETLS